MNHLKPQGLYVIEDWRIGYIPTWPDGLAYAPEPDTESRMPSHDADMVGFLKQLIDELVVSPIKATMTLEAGLCVIRKAASETAEYWVLPTPAR